MELGQLRALRELRDRGSIAAVAAAMHVTPSSVSQQLAALQRGAGAPLTRRDGRRTVLTDAGLALAAAAVEVERALARARSAVADYAEQQPAVSVCAFLSAAATLGPALLSDTVDAPRVVLTDEDVATEAFPALVADHDLVLAHRLEGSAPWPAHVAVRPLMTEPLDLAFREDHRLAGLRRITAADLAAESWVAVHEGFPLEDAVLRIGGASGGDASIAHRINDFGTAAAILARTDHLALLPRHLGARHPGVRLVPVPPSVGLAPVRRVDLLARPEAFERTGVRQVVARLERVVIAVLDPEVLT
jgi:DNA-binding transcriptional LysR family regulator